MKPSGILEHNTPSGTYWRVQVVGKKVQGHSSLESPLECNPDQMPSTNQSLLWPFYVLTIFEVTEICSFGLVLEEKTG